MSTITTRQLLKEMIARSDPEMYLQRIHLAEVKLATFDKNIMRSDATSERRKLLELRRGRIDLLHTAYVWILDFVLEYRERHLTITITHTL